MSRINALIRYKQIINYLTKNNSTFKGIEDFLSRKFAEEKLDLKFSKKTFDRDREDISKLFGIKITYEIESGHYGIEDNIDQIRRDKLFEAFDTLHIMGLAENISTFVHLEKIRPKGTDKTFGLIHSIKHNQRVGFGYRLYGSNERSQKTVEPYFLKEYRNRWYLVGKDLGTKEVKTFGLDRMLELKVDNPHFVRPSEADLSKIYEYSYGIYPSPPNVEPEKVVLSFSPEKGRYINSLPMHRSQKILIDNDKEFRIQLTIHTTYDFVMELLSHGSHVKVLEPQSLIDILRADYQRSVALYEGKEE